MRYEDSCVNEAFNEYADAHSSDEPLILQELFRETYLKMLNPRMISGKQQSHLLRFICRMKKPQRVLEIGTFSGYSAISMAMELPENGILFTIETNEEHQDIIEKYIRKAKLESKINLIIGDALNVIPSLNEKWDLVFMDGDKSEYDRYYDLIIDALNPGGIVLVDNVLWSGKVLIPSDVLHDESTRLIDAFNKRIAQDDRVEVMLLPLRDGILLIQKK
ncbi:MAG: O-methyltransferase [Bacteroidales bacterium]|nr:O-methyltransferase [Bacteroidales bacterium]